MQGKRVVGESIQTGSTTRNPIKHITIINKEYTRLGTTGGGVQVINKRHTESKTLNETYRIRRTSGNRWRETGTRARPDQTDEHKVRQRVIRKQTEIRKHTELKISQRMKQRTGWPRDWRPRTRTGWSRNWRPRSRTDWPQDRLAAGLAAQEQNRLPAGLADQEQDRLAAGLATQEREGLAAGLAAQERGGLAAGLAAQEWDRTGMETGVVGE